MHFDLLYVPVFLVIGLAGTALGFGVEALWGRRGGLSRAGSRPYDWAKDGECNNTSKIKVLS